MRGIVACLAMQCLLAAASAQPNLIRSDNKKDGVADWIPSRHVSLEATSERTHSGQAAAKVTWRDVRELRGWAQSGNLLRSQDNVLSAGDEGLLDFPIAWIRECLRSGEDSSDIRFLTINLRFSQGDGVPYCYT